MKNSNNEETPSIDSIRALFGPPPPRRPIPSNSFSTLVKIFSLFPDQNPFSDYASYANLPECPMWYGDNQKEPKSGDGHDESVVARDENKASGELIGAASLEVHNSPSQKEASNDTTREEFCIIDSPSGLDMVMNELCKTTNNTETMDKMASDEERTDVQMAEVPKVPETLSGIEKILMDDSDDMGMLGLPEKDVNFTFLNDFGSILDIDVCIDNTVAAESSQIRKLSTEGNIKENVVNEAKGKDVEVNKSIPGGHTPKSQGSLPMDREISNKEEAKSQHTGTRLVYYRNKEKKLCKEKDTNKLVEPAGLTFTAHKAKDGGGIVSSGDSVDSVGKGNKSDTATKGKLQTAKKASLKDVNLGQQKHISVNGEAPNSTKSGSADSLIHGKMVKQNARGNIGKSSTTKVRKSQPESSKGSRYTREQLLCLRNTTSVSEDILKAVQEIGADLHNKGQHSAGGKTMDISGANKEKQGSPTKAKLAKENEKDSSILKNKKRGSSSEARKEKKKRLKRKKRAEMNKKLGVKRLKLKPILKPKVVPDCRHYLQGRCQQGEQCKFSHDLIPLTKSKPCCHFARNACMKGDDCPFDHQLFKYPCKNYVDTGFCIRGDGCSFSHKVSATEGSITVSGVSKCETNSVLQLEESNSKHQLNAGFATPNSLKGDSARPISLPAMAPKGLSFLSFGKSSAENSAKHKEAEQPQQSSGDAAVTRALPNIVTETVSKINDDGSGRGSQLNEGISSKPVNVCHMFKGNLAPISPKTTDHFSYSGPSYVNSGGKSQATVPTNEHPNCQSSKKGTADELDKLKAVVQPDSPASLGQCSTKVGGARSTPSTAQRALLSTLAFAAKFESGIKMTSVAPSKEVNKNGGTTSDSGSRHNEESKASAILEFLYSGNNKE